MGKKKSIIYIVLFSVMLMIFFEPQMFKETAFEGVEKVDFIYKIAKLIAFAITAFLYLKENKFKISKLLIAISIIQVVTLTSTIIYSGDIMRFAGPAITTVTMCMIAELLISKKLLFKVLEVVNYYFIVCFIINAITVYLIDFTFFGITTTDIYFLGIDNRFIFTLLPWLLFEGLVSIHKKNTIGIRWRIVFFLCELLLIYRFTASAMLVVFIFALLMFDYTNKFRLDNFIFIGYLFANISIIVFKIQDLFVPLITMIGKDTTFAGRTYLWSGIIKSLNKYPIIGRGMQSVEYDKNFFYNSSAPYYVECCKVIHAHNSLMTLLYRGGFISLLVYLGIIYNSLRQLYNNYSSKFAKILIMSLIAILATSIFDTMDFAGLYFIIALIIGIDKLDYEYKKGKI